MTSIDFYIPRCKPRVPRCPRCQMPLVFIPCVYCGEDPREPTRAPNRVERLGDRAGQRRPRG